MAEIPDEQYAMLVEQGIIAPVSTPPTPEQVASHEASQPQYMPPIGQPEPPQQQAPLVIPQTMNVPGMPPLQYTGQPQLPQQQVQQQPSPQEPPQQQQPASVPAAPTATWAGPVGSTDAERATDSAT